MHDVVNLLTQAVVSAVGQTNTVAPPDKISPVRPCSQEPMDARIIVH